MAVLLVEDDALIRLTLGDFFEAAGIDFLEASNAEEALAIIDDPTQHIDVLVTDLDLGVGDNGVSLAIKARLRYPRLQVIYETGSPELLTGRAFSPREQVFFKPFDPVALAAAVSALNSSHRPEGHYQRPATSKTLASSL